MGIGAALAGMDMGAPGFNVTMKKDKLLAILAANRTKHEEEFKKAHLVWQKQMVTALRKLADKVEIRGKFDTSELYTLREPMNYAPSYARFEAMLSHTIEDTVSLDPRQYAQFVEDEWAWKAETQAINSTYIGGDV
jgi:hypothetical protein